jgi:hypothetical protein
VSDNEAPTSVGAVLVVGAKEQKHVVQTGKHARGNQLFSHSSNAVDTQKTQEQVGEMQEKWPSSSKSNSSDSRSNNTSSNTEHYQPGNGLHHGNRNQAAT